MRSFLFGLLTALLLVTGAPNAKAEQFSITGGLPATAFTSLNMGGGGNISGQSIPASGVRLVRCDGCGSYIFGLDSQWHLINGESNFCPSGIPCPYFGFYPANTSANQQLVSSKGTIELLGCPNSAACAYIYVGMGYVLNSTNMSTSNPVAITFCNTNFGPTTPDTSNDAITSTPSNPGPFGAVDPKNRDHVIMGTSAAGLFETFNGTACASAVWTNISTSIIPQASSYPNYFVAFDPTSPAVSCASGGGPCSSTVYVYTNGAPAGIYASFDGEVSWQQISSSGTGPSTIHHIKISAAPTGGGAGQGGGNVWVADTSKNAWEYNNASGTPCSTSSVTCSWHQLVTGNALDVSVNPLNGDHIAIAGGAGQFLASTNGASATPSFVTRQGSPGAGDTPWVLNSAAGKAEFGINGLDFDPLNNDVLLGHGAQWEWITTFATTNVMWNALSSGINGAVTQSNIQVGQPLTPTIGYEDITGCTFAVPTAATPPATCALPSLGGSGLYYYNGLSLAPGTTFMASKGSQNLSGVSLDLSGYSTDGFRTNYLPFNTWNVSLDANTGVSSGTGGVVRLNVGSTAGLKTFAPGDTLASKSIICLVGNLFNFVGILPIGATLLSTCWPINLVGDGVHIELVGSVFSSVTVVPAGNTYVAYVPAAAMSDWFGSGTVQNVTSTGGLVTVTFLNAGGGVTFVHGLLCISGVSMTLTTIVNGCWVPGTINGPAKTVTLQGSSFAGGDTYITGGTVLNTLAPGGGVAAASPTNIAIYGSNRTPAYCTTDAGASGWNIVNITGTPAAVTTVTGGPYSPGTTSITVASGALWTANGSKPVIVLDSGRYLDETGSTVSGNTVTLIRAIPPGDQLDTNSNVYGAPYYGGPNATFFRNVQIATDKVTPNTFYQMNAAAGGLVKWTNCGSTTVVATPGSPSFLTLAGNSDQLKFVPGQAGHGFYTAGQQTGSHPANNLLWRTCNGTNNTAGTVTMSSMPGFFEPLAVGFGAPYPGRTNFTGSISGTTLTASAVNTATGAMLDVGAIFTGAGVTAGTKILSQILPLTGGEVLNGVGRYTVNNSQTVGPVAMTTQASLYDTIIVEGWLDITGANNRNIAVLGTYKSIDDANAGVSGACTNTNTWAEISGTGGFPAGYPGVVEDIEGDPFIYGVYYSVSAFGQSYRIQNFLYEGDLHRGAPANDNDDVPVGLNKAA